MSGASTLTIGAIVTTPYEFAAQLGSVVNPKGFQSASLSGKLELVLCKQIKALVANPTARSTIGGVTGILEYVTATAAAIDDVTGYHLLQSWDHSTDGIDPDWPYASFSLKTVYIGDLPVGSSVIIDGGGPGDGGTIIDGGTP